MHTKRRKPNRGLIIVTAIILIVAGQLLVYYTLCSTGGIPVLPTKFLKMIYARGQWNYNHYPGDTDAGLSVTGFVMMGIGLRMLAMWHKLMS